MNCPHCQTPIFPENTKVTITGEPATVAVYLYCLKCVRFVYSGAVATLVPVVHSNGRPIARVLATSKKGT